MDTRTLPEVHGSLLHHLFEYFRLVRARSNSRLARQEAAAMADDMQRLLRLMDLHEIPSTDGAMAERVENAVMVGKSAFWAAVGVHFPEVTTGDFGPEDVMALERAMTSAVETWLMYNHPDLQHDEDLTQPAPEGETR
jgi:hypothetical protein